MLRLATVNGKRVGLNLVEKEASTPLQQKVNDFCQLAFKLRPFYLQGISDVTPFDAKRAKLIMNILLEKGHSDPVAYSIGNNLRHDCHDFINSIK